MINNICFNGHARIDTEIANERQLKLYKAVKEKKNKAAIKALPNDVEIKLSSKYTSSHGCLGGEKEHFNYYVAEFFKGDQKIGDLQSDSDTGKGKNFVIKFVNRAIGKCKGNLNTYKLEQQDQNVLDQIKSKDGLVI